MTSHNNNNNTQLIQNRNNSFGPLFSQLSDKSIFKLISRYLLRNDDYGKEFQMNSNRLMDQDVSLLFPVSEGTVRCLLNLSYVSRCFYHLCELEMIWRILVLNLTHGDFWFDCTWKQTFVNEFWKMKRKAVELRDGCLREDLVREDRLSGESLIEAFYSPYLYNHWMRQVSDLSDFQCPDMVPRINRVSKEYFDSHFDQPRSPCIITDLCQKWKGVSWSPDSLAERFPDHLMTCSQYNQFQERTKMTFAQYLNYMRQQKDGNPLYLFDAHFGEKIPQLTKEYKVPEIFWEDLFACLYSKRPSYRWIIVGPMRSGSNFHIDPTGTGAWNTLLYGRKRWALYPPDQMVPGIELDMEDGYITDFRAPNPMKWFYEVYPFLPPELKPIEFIQIAGDTVYISILLTIRSMFQQDGGTVW
eukprot:TRINITY_DN2119_c0_g1_i1.p1 TRINITY_DN2119_c0_g1~~TRINITY_DN2119_c0_g1_i1.p1  ORF type:complete len:422 (-),score=68.68 TRINITY_DN2119_c0_g1_i1:355-1596(-)